MLTRLTRWLGQSSATAPMRRPTALGVTALEDRLTPTGLTNPGFEDNPDLTGWTETAGFHPGSVSVIRGDGNAAEGTAYARLRLDSVDTGNFGSLFGYGPSLRSSDFTLTAGQTIGMSVRPVETVDDPYLIVRLVNAADDTVAASLYNGSFPNTFSWQTIGAVAPAAGDYYLTVEARSFDSSNDTIVGADIYVDNVRTDLVLPLLADVDAVTPQPAYTPVDVLTVRFSREIVAGSFTDADLQLRYGNGSLSNLSGSGVSITAIDTTTYQISGLAGLNQFTGSYDIVVNTAGINYLDNGDPVSGLGNAWEYWFRASDTTAPTVSSIVRAQATPTGASTVTYTVTFDESVTGVGASDFELTTGGGVTGASVTNVTGSGTTYTVTVATGTGDGTLRLDLKASGTGIQDAAGNAIAAGFTGGEEYTISRLPLINPSFEEQQALFGWTPFYGPSPGEAEIVRGSGEATDSDTYARLILDEADVPEGARAFGPGLRSSLFTLTAGQTVGLDFRPVETEDDTFVRVVLFDANGNRVATLYDGTFDGEPGWMTVGATAPADGDYYIEVQVGSFDDTFGGVIGAELHFDHLRTGVTVPLTGDVVDVTPTVTSATVSSLTVTFTRPVDPATFSTADLFLGRGEDSPNLITGAETITWVDATTVVIGGLAGLTNEDGVYRFVVDMTGVSTPPDPDSGLGNAWETWTRDTTPPAVTGSERDMPDPTAEPLVDFVVYFSEYVTGVDVSDFTLTTTGTLSGVSVVSVSGDGSSYTVIVNTGTGSGTIRLDVNETGTGIVDLASFPLNGGFTAGQEYTVDRVAPAVTGITRNSPNPTSAASVTYTVTFAEAVTGVDASDFRLTTTGLTGATITGVTGSGTTYVVTVSTGTGNGTLRLDLATVETGITDAAGNAEEGGFTGGPAYTVDKTVPAPVAPPADSPPVPDAPPADSPPVPGVPPADTPPSPTPTTFLVTTPSSAATGTQIKVFDPATGQNTRALVPFVGFFGAVDAALGDLTGDGVADVVVGAGVNGGPRVTVFDGATGAVLGDFFAFDQRFTGGVDVAVGDVTGDGVADLVVAAGAGGGPHVKVFDGRTFAEVRSFYAFGADFLGGVRLGVGDVNGDGKADIVTAAGPGAGPHVKAFSGADLALLYSFFAYAPAFAGGVNVAVGDVNGDGFADLITGAGEGGPPLVTVFDGTSGTARGSFLAYRGDFTGGVRVGVTDVNADGTAEIVTGAGPGGGPHVLLFDGQTFGMLSSTYAFDQVLGGGVFVG